MEKEIELKLINLARELDRLNNEITEKRKVGTLESVEERQRFFKIEKEIKNILSASLPIDTLRDPKAKRTLLNVRNGDYYPLDIESKKLENFIKSIPFEIVEKFFKEKGIVATDEEVDDYLEKEKKGFQEEITDLFNPAQYFKRKNDFSTLIIDRPIPNEINAYFEDLRICYIFGRFYAAIGLCRVIIEISIRDKFKKLGLGRKSNVSEISLNTTEMINRVCSKLSLNDLKNDIRELYNISSKLLHGRDVNIFQSGEDTLRFIKKTFESIERLYSN
jgi:hypothetical protein